MADKKRTVLVVDDNRDQADSLGLILELRGYAVHVAYSGADAVKLADTHRPDYVLVDIQMPQMSGFDVVRELRHHSRAPRPFLVALTAYGEESDRIASKRAGFDLHVTKPVEIETLLEALQRAGTA